MNKATIKSIHASYAFLRPDDGGGDVFAHKSAFPPGVFADVCVNDSVLYERMPSTKRPNHFEAKNVRLALVH